MAKTATRKRGSIQRQGRRVMPAPRRATQRKAAGALLTVGELIAAAYDTAGGENLEVQKLVTSPQMTRALGRRIVLVG
ncbi:hypothetical protein [Vitiosangium sp. GDMCC 1.1324]|uniref:hypothetical protein n=1 Tax=Vitiosangium sp. (strain GDMCC 1.1324) TaxID=2138576 RepID=UPI000D3CF961|nr:hypothetical protein [Vitiosangium sp. GDMCC 1.1324]PTL77656.1 hypothetical protein DAT35_43505 [Vitiosangium sp. GDMCC 1.1324]